MQIIQISGLTCAACQKLIGKRIKTITGVEDVVVELSGKTQITAPREIAEEEIKKVLAGTHYTVSGKN